MRVGYTPYEPQLVPVLQAPNLWTVEGPEVGFRLAGLRIPCPTRMTVVRLTDGRLWLHSPVTHTPELDEALRQLGPVGVLVAPNSLHHLHIAAWARAHPAAVVVASPDVATAAGATATLGSAPHAAWRSDLEQVHVDLARFQETVFFHRDSSTLVVTDLMQTFEVERIQGALLKVVMTLGGATGPNARPSLEVRLMSLGHRASLRAGVSQMRAWAPRRVVLSHGPTIQENAVAEIERAFDWVG